jgi:hypothetical protein
MGALLLTFNKILFFIRYVESLTRYIMLIVQTLKSTVDFVKVFVLFNFMFAMIYINLYIDDPGTDGDHPG